MGAPGWLSGVFAALMLTVAAYCSGRLVVARLRHRTTELDTDVTHVVMGVAMAGMLVSGLRTLPSGLWEGVFAAGAAWFGGRLISTRRATAAAQASPWRCLHTAPHLVECAAMLYMFLLLPAAPARAAAAMQAMSSPAESRFSVLTLAAALFLLGYAVRQGDRLTATAKNGAALAPRCATLCKIAMGLTMGYALILML